MILNQIDHAKWQYKYTSKNPKDQAYIRRNIRAITHIDWEDVDHLINSDDKQLASQMQIFKEAITKIRHYTIWNEIDESCPDLITVKFKFPNGKDGDINRGLALCYGISQPEQIDGLNWKVDIDPRKHPDIIDLIVNGQLGDISDPVTTEQIQAEPQARFLIKYNNYDKLRALTSGVFIGETLTIRTCYSTACSVQSNYYHQMKEARNQFYQDMIVNTGTSSNWKSEQQVYAITRFSYPDAVYQYHRDWLGLQSLDVYIPSLKIGIEYQGIQHYEAVDYFGGEEAFQRAVERDKRKKRLCRENGVSLIYWKYDEPINDYVFNMKMEEVNAGSQNYI